MRQFSFRQFGYLKTYLFKKRVMHDPIYCSVAITENLAIPRLRYPEFRKDLKTEKTALTFTDIEFLISKNSRSMIKVIMYVFLH